MSDFEAQVNCLFTSEPLMDTVVRESAQRRSAPAAAFERLAEDRGAV